MKSDELLLGVEWNPETGKTGKPVTFDLATHMTLFGPTGCGKGATLEIPNLLLRLHHTSIVSIDPTGQNAAITGEARRKAGSITKALNPMGLHVDLYRDLESCGCNPMVAGIDPQGPRFFEEAAAIGEALISVDGDPQKFFPEAARGLVTGLVMWVRLKHGDNANLGEVLRLLMEAEETHKVEGVDVPIKGLRHTASLMVKSGNFQIASLAGRYIQEGSRTIDAIRSTAETAARWLLSDPMRADLSKNGIDWAELTRTPTTVFIILPAEDLDFHSVWLRLMITCALNVIYRQSGAGDVMTLFMLAEFFSLGKLNPILAGFGQGRKYGVRFWPVLQDWPQLSALYNPDGALSFIANSGCFFAFTPGENKTAEFLSMHSGERLVLNKSASQNQQGDVNESISVQRERLWSPDRIRSVPEFHGLVWKYHHPAPTPVYLQPYFENPECLRLARPDPYRRGKSGGNSRQGRATEAAKNNTMPNLYTRVSDWFKSLLRESFRTLKLGFIGAAIMLLLILGLTALGSIYPEVYSRANQLTAWLDGLTGKQPAPPKPPCNLARQGVGCEPRAR